MPTLPSHVHLCDLTATSTLLVISMLRRFLMLHITWLKSALVLVAINTSRQGTILTLCHGGDPESSSENTLMQVGSNFLFKTNLEDRVWRDL